MSPYPRSETQARERPNPTARKIAHQIRETTGTGSVAEIGVWICMIVRSLHASGSFQVAFMQESHRSAIVLCQFEKRPCNGKTGKKAISRWASKRSLWSRWRINPHDLGGAKCEHCFYEPPSSSSRSNNSQLVTIAFEQPSQNTARFLSGFCDDAGRV